MDRLDRYFDYAATTPVDPRVVEEMLPFFSEAFGNAHSLHSFGRRALAAVDLARERVAGLIGAEDPSQIVFTSGATEANNQILRSFESGAVSPFEHSSIRETAAELGFTILPNHGSTLQAPSSRQEIISVMKVNNETGMIWHPKEFAGQADFLHSDLTQAAGKIPISVEGISFASLSAHKLYGPKGIGALYFEVAPPRTLLTGGEQESGIRGGTLNVPAIVGFGIAAQIAQDELQTNFAQAQMLRATVLDELRSISDWQVNESCENSPYILNISFAGVEGETVVVEMDREGFAVSSGAACSSQSNEPSHVLTALGICDLSLRGAIRISFGRYASTDSARNLSKSLVRAIEKLRRMKRGS